MNPDSDVGIKILNGDTLQIEGLIPAATQSVLALDPRGAISTCANPSGRTAIAALAMT